MGFCIFVQVFCWDLYVLALTSSGGLMQRKEMKRSEKMKFRQALKKLGLLCTIILITLQMSTQSLAEETSLNLSPSQIESISEYKMECDATALERDLYKSKADSCYSAKSSAFNTNDIIGWFVVGFTIGFAVRR
jgi:hypothetical protein